MSVKHAKVMTPPDDPAYEVSTDEWNEAHVIEAGTARIYSGSDGDKNTIVAVNGAVYWATDAKKLYMGDGTNWVEMCRGETATRLAQLIEKSFLSLTNKTGIVVLINADETDVSGTATNASAKSYALGVNTYGRIIVEAEIGLVGAANEADQVTFEIFYGDTSKKSVSLQQAATGTGDLFQLSGVIKYSESFQAGGTIKIAVTVNAGLGTWYVKSLRIYGVYT
jgi:hypothetical protein